MINLAQLGTKGKYKILSNEKLEALSIQLRYNRKLGGHQLKDGLKFSNKSSVVQH